MASDDIPKSARAFLDEQIRSVEQLEILLLLREEPRQTWTVKQVYDVILSTSLSVERWLQELVLQGLAELIVADPPSYRYAAEKEHAVQIAAVAEAYRTMPVRVIEVIYRTARHPAQDLAEAHRRKRPERK